MRKDTRLANLNRRSALLAMAAPMVVGVPLPSSGQGLLPKADLLHLVNALLPEDEHSPKASDLGVVDELLATVGRHPQLARLFSFGISWANQVAGRPFSDLPSALQNQVLQAAEQADFNQVPGRFFYVLRLMAVEIYYSHPEALGGFDLNDAPQPQGYLPPWG